MCSLCQDTSGNRRVREWLSGYLATKMAFQADVLPAGSEGSF